MAGEWWREAVIYQIYPRSFQDSDGDGVGDVAGVTRRLGYLEWLGVDAIWLSPIYPSPMADYGYDVSDYRDVDPVFGDLTTLEALIAEAHRRGMKVILDYVPNHTSDRHPWFLESRSSGSGPKRDWCVWRDPAPDGGPPNKWISRFGGSAWTRDGVTGQYYYHAFLPEQPDLNWCERARECREVCMHEASATRTSGTNLAERTRADLHRAIGPLMSPEIRRETLRLLMLSMRR